LLGHHSLPSLLVKSLFLIYIYKGLPLFSKLC
jgi:hypothetical protein